MSAEKISEYAHSVLDHVQRFKPKRLNFCGLEQGLNSSSVDALCKAISCQPDLEELALSTTLLNGDELVKVYDSVPRKSLKKLRVASLIRFSDAIASSVALCNLIVACKETLTHLVVVVEKILVIEETRFMAALASCTKLVHLSLVTELTSSSCEKLADSVVGIKELWLSTFSFKLDELADGTPAKVDPGLGLVHLKKLAPSLESFRVSVFPSLLQESNFLRMPDIGEAFGQLTNLRELVVFSTANSEQDCFELLDPSLKNNPKLRHLSMFTRSFPGAPFRTVRSLPEIESLNIILGKEMGYELVSNMINSCGPNLKCLSLDGENTREPNVFRPDVVSKLMSFSHLQRLIVGISTDVISLVQALENHPSLEVLALDLTSPLSTGQVVHKAALPPKLHTISLFGSVHETLEIFQVETFSQIKHSNVQTSLYLDNEAVAGVRTLFEHMQNLRSMILITTEEAVAHGMFEVAYEKWPLLDSLEVHRFKTKWADFISLLLPLIERKKHPLRHLRVYDSMGSDWLTHFKRIDLYPPDVFASLLDMAPLTRYFKPNIDFDQENTSESEADEEDDPDSLKEIDGIDITKISFWRGMFVLHTKRSKWERQMFCTEVNTRAILRDWEDKLALLELGKCLLRLKVPKDVRLLIFELARKALRE